MVTIAPRLFRPKRMLLLAVAPLLEDESYLRLTETEFVAKVMYATHGTATLSRIKALYRELREEAGLYEDNRSLSGL